MHEIVWNIEVKGKRRKQEFSVDRTTERLISKRLLTLDLSTFVHVDGIDAIDFFSAGLTVAMNPQREQIYLRKM